MSGLPATKAGAASARLGYLWRGPRPALLLVIALACLVGFVYRFNRLTPLWADDYSLMAHLLDGPASPLAQAAKQYLIVSGRFCTRLFTYFFLSNHGKRIPLFNVLNSVAFAVLAVAMFCGAHGRLPRKWGDLLLIALGGAVLWVGSVNIAEVALWKTGSVAYLWSMAFNSVVVAISLSATLDPRRQLPKFFSGGPGLVLLAAVFFVAGNTLESVSFPVSLLAVTLLGRHFLFGATLPRPLLISLFAYLLGAGLLFLSPGNFGRMEVVGVPYAGRLPYMPGFIEHSAQFFVSSSRIGMAFGAMLLGGMLVQGVGNRRSAAMVFLLLTLGSIAFYFVAVPWLEFEYRIAFPAEVFLCTAGLALLGDPLEKATPLRATFVVAGAAVVLVYALTDRERVLGDLEYLYAVVGQRDQSIEHQKANGITDVTTYPLRIASKNLTTLNGEYRQGRYFILDITPDPGSWINGAKARVAGVRSIRVVKE